MFCYIILLYSSHIIYWAGLTNGSWLSRVMLCGNRLGRACLHYNYGFYQSVPVEKNVLQRFPISVYYHWFATILSWEIHCVFTQSACQKYLCKNEHCLYGYLNVISLFTIHYTLYWKGRSNYFKYNWILVELGKIGKQKSVWILNSLQN